MVKLVHMNNTELNAGVVPEIGVGVRVLVARMHANLEQQELSDLTGLSRTTIGNYEKGRVKPRRSGLIAIAFATGVDLTWLETGKTPAGDNPGGGGAVGHQGLEPRTRCFGVTQLLTA